MSAVSSRQGDMSSFEQSAFAGASSLTSTAPFFLTGHSTPISAQSPTSASQMGDGASSRASSKFSAVAVAVLSVKGISLSNSAVFAVAPTTRQSVRRWRATGRAMQGRREVRAAALRGPTEDAAARSVRGADSGVRCGGERVPFPPAMTASGRGLLPPHSEGAPNFNYRQRSPWLAA